MKGFAPVLFVFVCLALAACVSNSKGYKNKQDVEYQLLNMAPGELAAVWGSPRYIDPIEGGWEKWHYLDQPDNLSGGRCEVDLFIKTNRIRKAIVLSEGKNSLLFPLESCRNLLNALPALPQEP